MTPQDLKEMQDLLDADNRYRQKVKAEAERNKPKFDPGRLAKEMILVPFLFDDATGKMEPTWVESVS